MKNFSEQEKYQFGDTGRYDQSFYTELELSHSRGSQERVEMYFII
jgi:hypothetical protein